MYIRNGQTWNKHDKIIFLIIIIIPNVFLYPTYTFLFVCVCVCFRYSICEENVFSDMIYIKMFSLNRACWGFLRPRSRGGRRSLASVQCRRPSECRSHSASRDSATWRMTAGRQSAIATRKAHLRLC